MPQELRGLAEDVGVGQRVAEASADRFPERAVQARRLKGRHAELQRGGSGGFWRISVMAGGADEVSAARVAGLFCASTDLSGLPYALSPAPVPAGRPGSPAPAEPGGDGNPAAPFYGSTELLAALVRPPEAEVPGVRFALRPEFDVTPETPAVRGGIQLGEVLDRNLMPAGPFAFPPTRSTGTCSSAARPGRASRRPSGACLRPPPSAASRGWSSSRPRPSTG